MMKFGTNIGYGKLYCVRKNQSSPAYQSLYVGDPRSNANTTIF